MTAEPKKIPAPKLRFKQFEGAGEWEEKKLGELLTVANGRDYKHLKKGNIPVYGTGGYMLSVDDYLHEGDSVTIGRKGTIDKPNLLTGKFWAVDTLFYTHSYRNTTARFIFYIFQKINWKDYNSASGVPSLTKSTIDDIEIPLPPLPEQTHIAACLSSLDAVISAHQSKLETLRQHKRGLMQQLFPQEGETVPRLRFPEFAEAGAWEEKKLGEVSNIRTGPFGSVLHQEDYVKEGTPIITVEHLGEHGIEGNNAPKVSEEDKERLSSYLIKPGDIVFSRVGSVDRCSIALEEHNDWLFSGRLLRLRIKDLSHNNPEFLYQTLKLESSKRLIRSVAVGQTMASLNTDILNNVSLPLPTLPEQKRIAACLSSLDELIGAQADKIAALQEFKRGLMQGLFPSTNAVQEATE